MTLRVVAIPLFAAICLGLPTTISAEQVQKGRGYRQRDGGGSGSGGEARRGGDDRGSASAEGRAPERSAARAPDRTERAERTATPRSEHRPSERTDNRSADRTSARTADTRGNDRNDEQRYARPREHNGPRSTAPRDWDRNDGRNNGPRIARNRPDVNIYLGNSWRGPRYYAPVYYDRWARDYYRWSPIAYAPWSLIYGSIGYSNFGFYGSIGPYAGGLYNGYHPGYYGYSPTPWQVTRDDFGGVRLRIRPRDAQVYVDGYYAGIVDDFDGTFQSLKLASGGHKIEIHMPGFEDLELDVHVQPGRTITLAEEMRPRP